MTMATPLPKDAIRTMQIDRKAHPWRYLRTPVSWFVRVMTERAIP